MSNDDKARKEVEEDANEDLELQDEDAEKVIGGEENPKETVSFNYGKISYEY